MYVYSHHHIVNLWRLMSLIGGGGRCVLFLNLVDIKMLRLSLALWVAYMRLPYERINCGPFCVLTLLTQGVSTSMLFCVAPVSAMPYVGL